MFQEDDDDQGNWEDDENDWSKWHHEDAHTAKEESSKDSSFVMVSDEKAQSEGSPSKKRSGEQDLLEAFKMVIEMEERQSRWSLIHKRKSLLAKRTNSIKKTKE